MLASLLALAVIVSSDGSTGGSPAQKAPHSHRASRPGAHAKSGASSKAGSTAGGTSGGTSPAPGSGTQRITETGTGHTDSGPPGGPVAYFVVTSPVAPGAPVAYTDESYDTASSGIILDRRWHGRRATFSTPGIYTVTLTVTDSYGRQSTYARKVLVSGSVAHPPAGRPHAFFLVTSPVAAGTPPTWTDESYDLDPGATIVNQIWSGRQAAYAEPGTYPVSLRVEDSTGAWSPVFTRDVVVDPSPAATAGTAPAASPVHWSLTASPNPATAGTLVTVTAVASGSVAGTPFLWVPAAFRGTWGGVAYATRNASGTMTPGPGNTFSRTIEVPASSTFPTGAYGLRVHPPHGAQAISATLVVQSASRYIEALLSGM